VDITWFLYARISAAKNTPLFELYFYAGQAFSIAILLSKKVGILNEKKFALTMQSLGFSRKSLPSFATR
jgi:hypothetical protein